jgi:hypothetical protein
MFTVMAWTPTVRAWALRQQTCTQNCYIACPRPVFSFTCRSKDTWQSHCIPDRDVPRAKFVETRQVKN